MGNIKDIPGCNNFALNEAPSPTPSSNKSSRTNNRGGSSQLTSQQETATSSSTEQQQQPLSRSNMTWNYMTINIFISELMKTHYKSLMDISSSTTRTKKWEQLVDVFMDLLRENASTKFLAVDGILNSRKLKDKWTELRNNYYKTIRSLTDPENVGRNGNDLWPYYGMMETVLGFCPSKESDVNIEPIKNGGNSTITKPTPHKQNLGDDATTGHSPPSISESTPSVTRGSDNGLSNSRKRRREETLGESLEGQDRIMDCIEKINEGYMNSVSVISETIAKLHKEQGEIMLQHFRQNHELTINTFTKVIKQNDDRWMTLFTNFFNNNNGVIIKNDNNNNGNNNSSSNNNNDNNSSSSSSF